MAVTLAETIESFVRAWGETDSDQPFFLHTPESYIGGFRPNMGPIIINVLSVNDFPFSFLQTHWAILKIVLYFFSGPHTFPAAYSIFCWS